jgi:hypothetical protein
MDRIPFTIIDAGRPAEVQASVDGQAIHLPSAAIERALGWELKPEGLCREGICMPLRPGGPAAGEDGLDLGQLAEALGRPLAVDLEERAAYLGAPARDRTAALASLQAPDFTLPDLEGRLHSLSDHRGKKVLLVAYASW